MTSHDQALEQITFMDEQFQQLTGHRAYGYVSSPTPTTPRIVFHDQHVCLSYPEAHTYMAGLLAKAQQDPSTLPYPFDQQPTPEQDVRTAERSGS